MLRGLEIHSNHKLFLNLNSTGQNFHLKNFCLFNVGIISLVLNKGSRDSTVKKRDQEQHEENYIKKTEKNTKKVYTFIDLRVLLEF